MLRKLFLNPASQVGERARTPDYYLQTLDPQIRAGFSPQQLEVIQYLLEAAIPKPSPKLVDLRFSVDLIISRFYVVLLLGKDRRSQKRAYLPEPVARLGNLVVAIMLLIGLNLVLSLFILLFAYLVKSALGIDLFPTEHLADQLRKVE